MKRYFSNHAITVFVIAGIILAFSVNGHTSGVSDVTGSLKDSSITASGTATISEVVKAENAASAVQSGVVMADCLNVRSGPWGDIIGTVSSGKKLDIIGKEGVWYKINYNGGTGYVHSGYVATESAPATASDSYVNVGSSTLNVRTGAWGTIIGSLSNGTAVEVLGTSGEWTIIKYNNKEAYVYTQYLSKEKPADAVSAPSGAVAAGSAAASGGSFVRPVDGGPITSPFGMRTDPINGTQRMHNGIDIGVGTGTNLKALGNGTVSSVSWNEGGGKTIKVTYDNGMTSTYMHCQDAVLSEGAAVTAGQTVGHTNNTGTWTTGPHLHFELRDASGNAVNPQDYINI